MSSHPLNIVQSLMSTPPVKLPTCVTGVVEKKADMFRPRVETTGDNVMKAICTSASPTAMTELRQFELRERKNYSRFK
jgi:hypothetical protein